MIARLSVPLLFAALLASASPAAAQDYARDGAPSNAAYLELGGTGFLYTVNLERRVDRWLGRVGGGYAVDKDQDDFWAVPVMVSTLWGDAPRYVETGLGLTLAQHPDDDEAFLYGSIAVGYRWIRSNGLVFRATLTPFFDVKLEEDPGLWAGVSVGWTW